MSAPTGFQHRLAVESANGRFVGRSTAVITEVAAGLRSYAVNGIDLVESFAETATPPMAAGIVLVPWPNRIRDGRWTQGGVTRQLAITEPVMQNASHGLLRFMPYRRVAGSENSVTLAATIFPQSGYPFHLETTVEYTLTPGGLVVTHGVHNVGADAAPYVVGAHPYLQIAGVPTSELTVEVSAATRILVDERRNPIGQESVDGTPQDLRDGKVVGALDLDDGYADVTMAAGRVEHRLTAPDGRALTLWGDENMRYVQVFTPRSFPTTVGPVGPDGADGADGAAPAPATHQAIAIEPMTAPANAFNSGAGLRWLQPGDRWSVSWGISHHGFSSPPEPTAASGAESGN
ncbi:aldose 1-epimerase family protein [Leifsonia kafniensis]|uniref:Aldose 1-epimerase family protein n=1 Tax=Leifsonia kafniensis TaxID=475957 RepID=A0ABP7JZ81_9MICO